MDSRLRGNEREWSYAASAPELAALRIEVRMSSAPHCRQVKMVSSISADTARQP